MVQVAPTFDARTVPAYSYAQASRLLGIPSSTVRAWKKGQRFVCIGKHRHAQIAENLVNSMHRMDRFVRKHRYPFIARLYMANEDERRRRKAGEVRMWLTYAAWRDLESRRRR